MMRRKRVLIILLAFTMAASLFTGCGEGSQGDSKDAKVLYHAYYSEPYVTLDPSTDQSNGIKILYNVYETLTHYDDKSGEVMPVLATKWSSNADATEWVFKLRED